MCYTLSQLGVASCDPCAVFPQVPSTKNLCWHARSKETDVLWGVCW